jgi:uncharacterized Zn-finger protein
MRRYHRRQPRLPEKTQMEPPEILTVDSPKVACDGGSGGLGHPRVFLNMQGKGQIDCPYCGRRFVLKQDTAAE